jgi:hypothetical protein
VLINTRGFVEGVCNILCRALVNLFSFYCFQVCVVGDFTESEVESCLLDYLGTVTPTSDEQLRDIGEEKPVVINANSTPELRTQQVCLQSDTLRYTRVAIYLSDVFLAFYINSLVCSLECASSAFGLKFAGVLKGYRRESMCVYSWRSP